MAGTWGLGVAMVKKNASAKKAVGKSLSEPRPLTWLATPDEGAELIRAFVAVKSPLVRKAIITFVKNLA